MCQPSGSVFIAISIILLGDLLYDWVSSDLVLLLELGDFSYRSSIAWHQFHGEFGGVPLDIITAQFFLCLRRAEHIGG